VLLPRQQAKLTRGAKDKEHAMSQTPNTAIAVIGIDIGKNSFHVVGHDARGAIVLRQKWSRGQVEARLANVPSKPSMQKREYPSYRIEQDVPVTL
jgi:transposase